MLERREFENVVVDHVIGWQDRRHCGCTSYIGKRLDNHETTFGAHPCEEHGAQVHRAMQTFQHMPPQDREVMELWREVLEHELDASGVRV